MEHKKRHSRSSSINDIQSQCGSQVSNLKKEYLRSANTSKMSVTKKSALETKSEGDLNSRIQKT